MHETDHCPCCEADMEGSDHCSFCGCEAHQSYHEQHLRDHARALMTRLRDVRETLEASLR